MGQTMGDVVSSIQKLTTLVNEISQASQDQSTGVHEVGDAVAHIDQVTQQNAALVEEIAAAASELNHQADELVRRMAHFTV
jgi:methyl-accepting chemotaxis protein